MNTSFTQPSRTPTLACLRQTVVAVALIIMSIGTVGAEPKTSPGVAPINSRSFGESYSQWAAAWWQWNLAIPVQDAAGNLLPHPSINDARFDVTQGQSGHVWFLAAPFGAVERTATIPEGTALFVALINVEASSLEEPPFFGASEADQRAVAKSWADQMINVFCTIDDVSVNNIDLYRVVSPQFNFTAPTPWIFGADGGTGTSVADGYYVMVKPLSKGQHTLHFGGAFSFDPANAYIDMTYHLNVTGGHPGGGK